MHHEWHVTRPARTLQNLISDPIQKFRIDKIRSESDLKNPDIQHFSSDHRLSDPIRSRIPA